MRPEHIIGGALLAFLVFGSVWLLASNTTQEKTTVEARGIPYTEIVRPSGFVNTKGITIGELVGKKVILVEFLTYSCINCQRTFPYVASWYSKYKDEGLEIIGIHTPEFAFEKDRNNVQEAMKKSGIEYPIVLDNEYATWNAYGNKYWPHKYLIDINGNIIYDHIGEGAYEETEKAIQSALKERAVRLGIRDTVPTVTTKPSDVVVVETERVKSPETYVGSARNTLLANGKSGVVGEQTLLLPTPILFNKLYLEGVWNITPEYAESKGKSSLVFRYEAKNVYITAGSLLGTDIEVYKDGLFVKRMHIKEETLYPLIQGADYDGMHTLKIVVPSAGLQVFTLTFG